MEGMEGLGEAEVDLSSSFLSPYPMGAGKVGIYVCLSALLFFRETGAERDFPTELCVCSLSRLCAGREIWWS